MANFNLVENEVFIVDDFHNRAQLNPRQALDLLQWLFERQDDLQVVVQPARESLEERQTEREQML